MLNGVKATKELLNALDSVKKPPTNADRIRAMSDEELAEWMFEFDCEAVAIGLMQMEQGLMTKEERLEWLQQPTEGE